MKTLFGLIIIGLVVIPLLKYLAKKLPGIISSIQHLPYEKRSALFSPAEKLFLDALRKAVAGRYEIFGKVRMADIIDVKSSLSFKDHQIALNAISSKHIDYVLCDALDSSILCGIELDDKSHNHPKRVERDAFVDKAFEAASIPLLRFEVKAGYNENIIKDRIDVALGVQKNEEPPVHIDNKETTPEIKKEDICPKCNSQMIRRKASAGPNAGKTYWVCSNYKNCKTAIAID